MNPELLTGYRVARSKFNKEKALKEAADKEKAMKRAATNSTAAGAGG
jgi:hypothetical protein